MIRTETDTMIQVPLVDLRATYQPIRQQIFKSFEDIFDKMGLFLGENVQALEREFTEYVGAAHGLGVSNGTDAVTLVLKSLDLPVNSEVIVPAHTFFATIESVVHAGCVPVMVDIDAETYTLDPGRIEEALSPNTSAIMPVHIYGQPADMDPILDIARAHGLKVIEDAAQAHGATYKGRTAGSLADAAAFSFYFTKNLGAFGEAGFVTASDSDVFERMKLFRHHGHASKFEHTLVGYNMRIDELQAAILRAKLPSLDANNARRRAIASRYNEAFVDERITTPRTADYAEHNFHCYVIQLDDREGLATHLADRNVGTGIHYKNPAHLQPAMRTAKHRALPMPVTEAVCRRCITLPCYSELSDAQINHVIESVRAFIN